MIEKQNAKNLNCYNTQCFEIEYVAEIIRHVSFSWLIFVFVLTAQYIYIRSTPKDERKSDVYHN